MTIIFPTATPVQGNTKVKFCLAIATLTAPSLATEINAASSLDVSFYIRDWNPQLTTNTGNSPNRLGTSTTLPVEGNTQFSPVELRFVYDPQAADTTNENKLKAMLPRGTIFYAVVRKGLDAQNTAFAATQHVEVWKCRAGKQNRTRSGDDEFSEYELTQNVFPLQDLTDGIIAA